MTSPQPTDFAGRRGVFESTQWSIVLLASDEDADHSRHALSQLCESYWYPLYAYVRRRECSHHDAMDLTQEFFVHLIANNGLASVHPEKGRFRAFLLASIRNFMASQWRKKKAIRRGGDILTFTVDDEQFEQQYQRQLATDLSAEDLFERNWIESLLAKVMSQLRDDYNKAGKSKLFDVIYPWLVANEEKMPQANIGEELGMSEAAVGMSVYRIRKRYAELVRHEIAQTVSSPSDVDDELSRLMSLLR